LKNRENQDKERDEKGQLDEALKLNKPLAIHETEYALVG
jgi:hypothetical protein